MPLINLPDFTILGIILILVATLLIALMLKHDFSFKGPKKWFIGLALGMGVLAFSIKIVMIVLFSSFTNSYQAITPHVHKTLQPSAPSPQSSLAKARPVKNYVWEALPKVAPVPANNPQTTDKIILGKKLFFDKRLSANDSVACSSCHELSSIMAGSDGKPTSTGIFGQQGSRNAPTVLNTAFQRVLFWDGRASSLEEQAKEPLVNPVEMGMPNLDTLRKKIQSLSHYESLFDKAFISRPSITVDNIVKAIASYERVLITPNTAYDRFVRGEQNALNRQQIRGMALFESTGCIQCHSGPNFSGASLFQKQAAFRLFPTFSHSDYVTKYRLVEDTGIVNKNSLHGVWRVPSLRNVSRTAPYFHNGSVNDLKEAIRVMATVQLNKTINNTVEFEKQYEWIDSEKILEVKANNDLSEKNIDDIAAFLEALTGSNSYDSK